jgi:tetratricopeptide (TPR) repeat protein
MIVHKVVIPRGDESEIFANSACLVVDDFPNMRTMLVGLLRACGANSRMIDTAANGPEAIAMLGKRRYDIVLCDFNFGAGQNGMQILEEARHKNLVGPACCWLVVTAEKTSDIVMGTAEVQPDAYLIKPITEATLMTRIQKIKARKESLADIDRAIVARDFLKAIRLCDERAAVDKANAIDLLRIKCDLLVKSGQFDKAKQAYEKVLNLSKHEVPWAQIGLARSLMQAKNYEAACELLEPVVDRNRSFLDAYDCLAECYLALGEKGKAENILERALNLSSTSHKRQRVMGELSLQLGNLDRAEQSFRKSVSLAEYSVAKTPDAYLGLARTIGEKANPEEALKVLDQLEKKFSGEDIRLKAKVAEGMIYQRNNNPKKAQEVALELSGMLDRTSTKLDSASTKEAAELLLVTGKHEKGFALLKMEVANNPEDSAHLDSVRDLLHKVGLSGEGNAIVEEARHEAIEAMNACVLLAKEGKHDQAVEKVRKAIEKMPRNVRLLLNAVHIMIVKMEAMGNDLTLIREARKLLLSVNQLAPGEPRFATLMSKLEAMASADT